MKLNWEKNEDYGFVGSLSNERLAWEFLRRNEDYKNDWKKAMSSGVPGYPRFHYFGKKWHLQQIIDPDADNPPLEWTVGLKTPILTRGSLRYLDLNIKDKIALGFDLTKSIPAQIKYAKKALGSRQKRLEEKGVLKLDKAGNRKPPDYASYLRALDARAKNISRKEIAQVLFPWLNVKVDNEVVDQGVELVKETLKQARKIMRQDYRKLLIKPN